MVAVAQLVESRIVIPVVVGSSPISHPKNSAAKTKGYALLARSPLVFLEDGFQILEDPLRSVVKQAPPFVAPCKRLHGARTPPGQPYTVSGFNTVLRRLKVHCTAKAEAEGIVFTRFTLSDMRPAAVTDRVVQSPTRPATTASAWSKQVYDRRKVKAASRKSSVKAFPFF
jgi:hypothetical protein